MIPRRVSLSCNANPFYLEFWEPVSKLWTHKCGFEPWLFFVGDEKDVPPHYHGTVVRVPRVDGVPEHTQAQWARFFFTQSDPDCVWITSDIDMFPLSPEHFLRAPAPYADDCFVALNSDLRDLFPVCYNVASGRTFKEVLELEDTFEESVRTLYASTSTYEHTVDGVVMRNWGADEEYTSRMICRFRTRHSHRVVQVPRPGGFPNGRRIDRLRWGYQAKLVKRDWYLDCHSLRPYSRHRREVDELVALALRPRRLSAALAIWRARLREARVRA
jgi:hypothetical protein